MIRSFFLSIGMFVLLCGAAFLMVDKIVLNSGPKQGQQEISPLQSVFLRVNQENRHELTPPDWSAFGLMAMGSITILYTVKPRNKQG